MGNCERSFLSIPLKTSNFHSSQNWEELDLSLMKILLKLLKNTLSILALFTHDTFFSQPDIQIYTIILALFALCCSRYYHSLTGDFSIKSRESFNLIDLLTFEK